ncbi:MAG: DNA helicase RecQ [Culicoidibacterales bacterium]
MNKQTPTDILQTYFGYQSFRGGQTEIINALLTSKDALAIMPTGAGKSICYQVPAMIFEGITIVISPLIALMQDQVDALKLVGIGATFINSSLNSTEIDTTIANTIAGHYKLIYIAPEQLTTTRFLNLCQKITISFISIDEAHCVSQWGHDFRPGYLKIQDFIAQLPTRPVIGAFTATATQQVKDDISAILNLDTPFSLTTGFDRENLHFSVLQTKQPYKFVHNYISQNPTQNGIIYVSTRKGVEDVCQKLIADGINATFYHAGLDQNSRSLNQDSFVNDNATVMVATNAFGMGIDKSNVNFVIHYNMPKNMESYYQEAGRAGRDGTRANCFLLYSGKDVRTNQFFIDSIEVPEGQDEELTNLFKQTEHLRLKQMTFYCFTQNCLRHYILNYFGEKAEGYCGNCSNCQENFEKTDITIQAQKILSCIKRLGQNFGIKLVVDVLRGSKNSRITQAKFDELKLHGSLNSYSENQVRHMIQCLLVEGFIQASVGQYPVLSLTNRAKEILFENLTFLVNLPKPETKNAPVSKALRQESQNPELFAKLQALRRTFAQKQNVPAYIIFSNATLEELCNKLPRTLEEMAVINGIGKVKLELYGDAFLAELSKQ